MDHHQAPEINPKTRPSRNDVMMQVAQTIALRSTCSRAQVGAVIVIDGRIISTGYNGAPAHLPHCTHQCTCEHWVWITEGNPHDEECPADSPCLQAVHAEANAIAFASRHGTKTEGAELFTTLSPCVPCAMLIINAGIQAVHAAVKYRDDAGVTLLRDAQVLVFF